MEMDVWTEHNLIEVILNGVFGDAFYNDCIIA